MAFRFNVAYADSFGHHGASHSAAFAMLVALVASMFTPRLHSNARIAFVFVGVNGARFDDLPPVLPVLGSYVLSFINVEIYWSQHQYANYPPSVCALS